VDVPVEDEGAFVDVDTPEEYERVMRAQHSSPFLVRPT
jgi:CTP:molybdopterin cytidylyltransferase MocA